MINSWLETCVGLIKAVPIHPAYLFANLWIKSVHIENKVAIVALSGAKGSKVFPPECEALMRAHCLKWKHGETLTNIFLNVGVTANLYEVKIYFYEVSGQYFTPIVTVKDSPLTT